MRARDQLKLEDRRAALHKLSAAAVQIRDTVALFDGSDVAKAAGLDSDEIAAAASIATQARALSAGIKRQIAALNEDS